MKPKTSGGGWAAVAYTLRMANRVGWLRLWKAMRAKNACKTCALGMGGQSGGMRNEMGHWPEVCKKSLQAMVADMQEGLRPDFFERYSIAQLQTLSPRELESCGRLVAPVYAGPGDTHFRTISWEEALSRVIRQFGSSQPHENFFYASGRSSNEAGFVFQLFARVFGTNFVNNCSFYCHQASGVALSQSLGSGTATLTLEDVEKADLFVLIGGNPASNHPRLMRSLMNIRRHKGHVIVVNPVKEIGLVNFAVPSDVRSLLFGSKISSLYVQPHIGGDIALLTGVAKLVLERNALDRTFLDSATEGFEAYADQVAKTSWEWIEQSSGVDHNTIQRVAEMYCAAKDVVFAWTMGITHHEHGVANVNAIVNLALLRGMVGRAGRGLLPIRGHSNVQGLGSMGVVPNPKEIFFKNLEANFGVSLPRSPGLDTMSCMQACDRGEMRSAFCLGGNLYGSNPDANFARSALGKLELVTYLNTTLNTGHAWGHGRETLILPVLARDEEPQPTTQESMFNFVRFSDGQETRLLGPRGEVDIITTVAQHVLDGRASIDWKSLQQHSQVREYVARSVGGYEQVAEIDRTKREFYVKNRVFHESHFPTPSGKARFIVHEMPPLRAPADKLRLMTVRSEGQFNTVVYEDEDIYRGQDRRDVILMNSVDIQRLGLRVDQRVVVRSSTAAMRGILVREYDIRAGNALMYYPEANVLVPTTVDRLSGTPAFKNVLVSVSPDVAATTQAPELVTLGVNRRAGGRQPPD